MTGPVRVCSVADLPAAGGVRRVDVDGDPVAIVVTADGLFAIDDICSHDEVSLSDGDVEGNTVECWLHGSKFDVRTGAALCLPARKPVAVFDITIEGDGVYVNTTPVTNSLTKMESNA
ncbi:MAG: non-heme iron oxygenase ferredoxin subunit [Acidothermaceae bacterium]